MVQLTSVCLFCNTNGFPNGRCTDSLVKTVPIDNGTVFVLWAVTKYIHQIKEQIKTSILILFIYLFFWVFLRLAYTKRPVYLLDNEYSLNRAYLNEEMMRALKWLEIHTLFTRSTIY